MVEKHQVSIVYMLLGILFCVCLITSNILEFKVVQIWRFNLTGGLLIFPISYIINDCIAEVWGFYKTRLIIWTGFFMNFLFIVFTQLAVLLPGAPFWEGKEAFDQVLDFTPRIAFASLIAFLIGSYINAAIISRMKVSSKGRFISFRYIVSTVAGESADSFLFFPLAFAGTMPWTELIHIILLQILLKTMYEVVALPLTIPLVKKIKSMEHTDQFDHQVSYQLFKFHI
ncbi:MAG: queuosine precursor transporter [Bacteroidales bacterium]|nr:queuosine precursor transporter [Bacteroidales bacterium]